MSILLCRGPHRLYHSEAHDIWPVMADWAGPGWYRPFIDHNHCNQAFCRWIFVDYKDSQKGPYVWNGQPQAFETVYAEDISYLTACRAKEVYGPEYDCYKENVPQYVKFQYRKGELPDMVITKKMDPTFRHPVTMEPVRR